MAEAGADGVEIVASHGYLPAQFLNPRVNRRDDDYGGSADKRLRFLKEVIAGVRRAAGPDLAVGLRISGDEQDPQGLTEDTSLAAIVALAPSLDYVSVVAGTSASLGGAVHIVPPMLLANAYVAPFAARVKAAVSIPVIVTGRINQPHEAEKVIASGEADLCGMTRALICDPQMPAKASAGRIDDIRACIACNQACIGHRHMGFGVSCIQFPETGREERFAVKPRAARPRSVLVAGGGPAGLKAAAVAAERGHRVTLCERDRRLGGQALLASALPRRAEFGGIVTNLAGEAERAGVRIRLGVEVTPALVTAEAPEVVIVATGAGPRMPEIEGAESAHVIDAWDVIAGTANPGPSVAVADWRCDWTGLGVAEKLARDGCHVRLFVAGIVPGEMLQAYVRDQWIGELHRLGVVMVPYAQAFGVDGSTAYFRHMSNGDPILCEGVDTLVMAQAPERRASLAEALTRFAGRVVAIGDCLSPRSAEEAVYEGLEAAMAI
jgi:hypothetical protein